MKIQDMLFTGVGVLLVSKAGVLVDNIDLNWWRKKEKEELRLYHAGQNDYRYRSEIKSKTIGLYQITGVTVLY